MVFDINGKVALVTGGASGIGLNYVKELLRNGAKGVTMADVNATFGAKAIAELETEFGADKTTFVICDVTKKEQVEAAFETTIEKFGNVDILINNAGILNEVLWEKQVEINVTGTCHGCILAMEKYLPKYKSGEDAVMVNISSMAGVRAMGGSPIYAATKHAVLGMTRAWGDMEHYERTKVRCFAICPGVTNTPLIAEMTGRHLSDAYEQWMMTRLDQFPTQEPEFLAKEMMKLIQYAPNGTAWMVEGGQPAYQFIFPDDRTMKDNVIDKLIPNN